MTENFVEKLTQSCLVTISILPGGTWYLGDPPNQLPEFLPQTQPFTYPP